MNKICHRGFIKFLREKCVAPNDIDADMVATLGDVAPALSTAKAAAESKRGLESLEDEGLDVLSQPPSKHRLFLSHGDG